MPIRASSPLRHSECASRISRSGPWDRNPQNLIKHDFSSVCLCAFFVLVCTLLCISQISPDTSSDVYVFIICMLLICILTLFPGTSSSEPSPESPSSRSLVAPTSRSERARGRVIGDTVGQRREEAEDVCKKGMESVEK